MTNTTHEQLIRLATIRPFTRGEVMSSLADKMMASHRQNVELTARVAELEAVLGDVLNRLANDMTEGDYTRCIRSPQPAQDGPALNAARAALAKVTP